MSWTTVKLGDVCETASGGTPKRDRAEFYDGEIPWVKSGELKDSLIKSTSESISHLGLQNSSAKIIPKGTLLIAMYGATVGKLGILDIEAASNQAVCAISPSKQVDQKYLFHYLFKIRNKLIERSTGGAQPNISQDIIRNLEITLPPLDEQKRIAEVLDKADALRQKRRFALQKLDTLLQSVFLEMFGDPKTNPKNWSRCPTSDVLSREKSGIRTGPFGSSLKKHEYTERGIPVWGINNVRPNSFIESAPLYISDTKFAQLDNYRVECGDILISRAGTVGRMCVAMPSTENSIIGTNLIRLALNKAIISPIFFSSMFTYFGERIASLKASGDADAYSFLNPKTLRAVSIPVPPIELQRQFDFALSSIEKMRTRFENQLSTMIQLFKSLQDRAFKGELFETSMPSEGFEPKNAWQQTSHS